MVSVKSCFFLFFFFKICFLTHAQSENFSWGDFSDTEVNMTIFEKDSSAEALILRKRNSIRMGMVSGTHVIVTEHHIRIKILKTSGLQYADWIIPYYSINTLGEVSLINGSVFTLNNNHLEEFRLKKKDIYQEKVTDNLYRKRFALPGAKVGSIIEVSYTIISPYFHIPSWNLQEEIPMVYCENFIEIPVSFNFSHTISNVDRFEIKERYKKKVDYDFNRVEAQCWKYVLKDIPALKTESYVKCMDDYRKKIVFHYQSSAYSKNEYENWPQAIKTLLTHEYFGAELTRNHKLANNIIESIPLNEKGALENLKQIYYYVTQNIIWDGSYSHFMKNDLNQLFKTKTGNSADINLFLILLIRDAGYECVPVLCSTRSNGKPQIEYPAIADFNHVVCMVTLNDQMYLLDATSPYRPYDLVNSELINTYGKIIELENTDWIKINAVQQSIENSKVLIDCQSEFVNVSYVCTYDGYKAEKVRRNKSELSEKEFQKYIDSKLDSIAGWSVENNDEPEKSLKLKYSLAAKKVKKDEKHIYLEPFSYVNIERYSFDGTKREFPIDLNYGIDINYTILITIPENYELDEIPEDKEIKNLDLQVDFKYTTKINKNIIQLQYQLKMDQIEYGVEQYYPLKDFLDVVASKEKELIILKLK